MSTTIRVSSKTRDRLASLAGASGQPMTVVVDEALDALERRHFFAGFNERYAALREDEHAWAEIEAERAEESHTINDRPR